MTDNKPNQSFLTTPLTATCVCKAIQLQLPPPTQSPVTNYICHCLNCRKELGCLFAWQIRYQPSDVKFAQGEDLLARWPPLSDLPNFDTSEDEYLGFCRICGTSLISVSHKTIAVRGGALDLEGGEKDLVREWMEGEQGRGKGWWPKMELFTKRRPAWFKAVVEGAEQRRELKE